MYINKLPVSKLSSNGAAAASRLVLCPSKPGLSFFIFLRKILITFVCKPQGKGNVLSYFLSNLGGSTENSSASTKVAFKKADDTENVSPEINAGTSTQAKKSKEVVKDSNRREMRLSQGTASGLAAIPPRRSQRIETVKSNSSATRTEGGNGSKEKCTALAYRRNSVRLSMRYRRF